MVGSVSEWDIHVVIELDASRWSAAVTTTRVWLLLHWLVGQHIDDFPKLLRLRFALQDFACHQFGIGLEYSEWSHAPASFASLEAILHLCVFLAAQKQANRLAHKFREAWRRHHNLLVFVPLLDFHLRHAELARTQASHHGVHHV